MSRPRFEDYVNALLNGEPVDLEPRCRMEQYLKNCIDKKGTDDLPVPRARAELLLYQLAEQLEGGITNPFDVTEDGAEIWVVIDGQCGEYCELGTIMSGGTEADVIQAHTTIRLYVKDELPLICDEGIASDDTRGSLCVTKSDGKIWHDDCGEWASFAEMVGLPEHGWIEKSELEALDHTDAANMGFYVVKTVSYPMMNGTVMNLTSTADKVFGSFQRSLLLNTVDLPNATIIGKHAFQYCFSLKSLNIPKVKGIGEEAFYSCRSLTDINWSDSLVYIGERAFSNCTSLTSVNIPDSVTNIGASAFYDCYNLTSVNIPDSVMSIGNYAFYDCTGLTTLTFTGTPTTIANNAFYDCTNLTTINVPWAEGAVADAPWGATNATINYNYTGE